MESTLATAPTAFEQKTVRKWQSRLLPFLFAIYVVAFIDRTNISIAALTMNRELAIASHQFGLLSGIFFVGYFLFEIPSNYLLHRIGARVWIARILLSWGVVATLTGFVQNVQQLYFMRFLLGVTEAGYLPGILLYLTYWCRRRELAQTTALLLAGAPIANSIGAPIGAYILDHVHWWGMSSWRWVLVLEGLPAILFGFITYFVLPNRPADAAFLDKEERNWLTREVGREEQHKLELRRYSVRETVTNARVWYLTVIYFGGMVGGYVFNFWGPQVLASAATGASKVTIGLFLMLVNLVALTAMFLVSRSSDRKMERRLHAAVPLIALSIALLLMSSPHNLVITIAVLTLMACGYYCFLNPFWALPNEFLAGASAAIGIALINSVGNLGGLAGPYAVGAISHATGNLYIGLAVCAIPVLLSGILVLLLRERRSR
jgi:ACS family tartrate transporter-like MFS transporter